MVNKDVISILTYLLTYYSCKGTVYWLLANTLNDVHNAARLLVRVSWLQSVN